MLPTPLASSDITVFILSPGLSLLLGEAPGIGSAPSLFLGPRTDVLQTPFLPGLPGSQILQCYEPPASGEGPPPLCYLGDHPVCQAILQVKRHVCRKGLLTEPAAGLCQMPLALPGLRYHDQGSWKHPRQDHSSRAGKGTDSGVKLTSWKLLDRLLIYASVSSS